MPLVTTFYPCRRYRLRDAAEIRDRGRSVLAPGTELHGRWVQLNDELADKMTRVLLDPSLRPRWTRPSRGNAGGSDRQIVRMIAARVSRTSGAGRRPPPAELIHGWLSDVLAQDACADIVATVVIGGFETGISRLTYGNSYPPIACRAVGRDPCYFVNTFSGGGMDNLGLHVPRRPDRDRIRPSALVHIPPGYGREWHRAATDTNEQGGSITPAIVPRTEMLIAYHVSLALTVRSLWEWIRSHPQVGDQRPYTPFFARLLLQLHFGNPRPPAWSPDPRRRRAILRRFGATTFLGYLHDRRPAGQSLEQVFARDSRTILAELDGSVAFRRAVVTAHECAVVDRLGLLAQRT